MFLTELKEKLDGLQTERGNIPLSMARIMHEHTLLVSHSDFDFDDDDDDGDPPAEANGQKPTLIAEAEGVAGTLEERLEKAGIVGVISVTGEELAQLLEFKAEALATAAAAPGKLELVMQHAAAKLPAEVADLEGKGSEVRMPCPQFDENKVACVLAFGHEGDHDFDPAHAPEAAKG